MMKQAIHMTHNRLVAGSNPAGATKFSDVNHAFKPPFRVVFMFSGSTIGSRMAADILHSFLLWFPFEQSKANFCSK
ncbi:hypothetical protein ABEH62_04585 [Pantoea eucalypti]|uniref:hypothetical protein n=1 Tax=Pantoea eucalypti TaxID=470933 RepID=UPI0016545FC5|nr:hypothetical protein [Pantoea eucalypti]